MMHPSHDARLPLLLMPGLLCDAALWAHQIETLSDLALPMVADLTQADTIAAMATQVLAAAPARFALAALSMGGYVAFEIMRREPARVAGLCLVDTTARPDTEEQRARRRALLHLARSGKFKGVTPRLIPTLVHPDHAGDPAIAGVVMAMAERVGRDAFIRQQSAIIGRVDSRPGLSAITAPTLCIVGEQDQVTPPDRLAEVAAAVPGARFAQISPCGHLAPLEQPGKVSMLMREWLMTVIAKRDEEK